MSYHLPSAGVAVALGGLRATAFSAITMPADYVPSAAVPALGADARPADRRTPRAARRSFWATHCGWLNRPCRVTLLLLAIWALNALDLHFTLTESLSRSWFVEANPLAALALGTSLTATVVFKASMILLSTGILWFLRRRALVELASWFLAMTCLSLMVHWYHYYQIAPRIDLAMLNAQLPLH